MVACPSCGQENPDGFRFCGACAALLVAETPKRRKLATLLFCDVSGSTALGERLDAESVRDVMSRYFAEARQAIERHGGTVEKFIGDAIVGVFGVPVAHEDDALRAVRAATEMSERLKRLNYDLEQRFGVRISVRVGINTGEVVAGDASMREMIVTGDAVNVAARLEQAAGPGEILAGESTYDLVRDGVIVEAVEPLAVKGKTGLVTAYRIVDVRVAPQRQVRAPATQLVGRTRELGLLEDAFADARTSRSCRFITVLGEPGVGKSRLVKELTATLGESATVLRGRCLPYGEGITFWPIAELVREAAGIDDAHSRAAAEARIRALLAGEEDVELVATRIGQAIGLTAGDASGAEIAWAIRRLLETLGRRGALVLVLDDLQWAEETLLKLVAEIPGSTSDAAILLLCLARPELLERRPKWAPLIRLEPLDGDDTARLVDELVGDFGSPPGARERIARAGGGNPLFVEELVRMLSDEDRALARGALELPTTLNALLGARLDRLPEAERAAAERGAIEGELFHQEAVVELSSPERRARMAADLDALVRKEFLRPAVATFSGGPAFRFRHLLVRDVAYHSVAKKLRSELHERFAAWLERMAADRLSEYEAISGYHLEQAYRYESELGQVDERGDLLAKRAGERLAGAGRRAFARGDMAAAANLLGRACTLVAEGEGARLPLLLALGSARARLGELERADETFAAAASGARAASDDRLELTAMVERASWRLWSDPWSSEDARRVARSAIDFFGAENDAAVLAKAWHLLADAEPRWRENTEALERAVACARRAGDVREEADALWWLAVSLYFGPTPVDEAVRRCEQILANEISERTVEAGVLGVLGGLRGMEGRFDEARALFSNGLAILEQLGIGLRMASRRTISGAIELLAGEPVAAERELRWGFERLQEMGEHQDLPGIAGQLAEALYRQGRYDEAEPFAAISEGEDHPRIRWRGPAAKLAARRGELNRAVRLARAAVSRAAAVDNLNSHGNALLDLAEVLRLAGRGEDATPPLLDAVRVFEQKRNVVAAAKTRAILERAPFVA